MKNTKKFFKYLAVLAVVVLPIVSLAAEFRAGDQPSFGKGEQAVNDLYMTGGSVSSAGNIAGDLVAGGGNIAISGDVGGDVMAGGGNVSILSNVGDDVRVAGGQISITGKVGGDLVAGGGQISVSGPGVYGDAVIGGEDVRIEAPVVGKLSVRSGSVFINSTISGNVDIKADVVKLGSSAVILGDFTYKARRELEKDPAAVIMGKVTFEERSRKTGHPFAFIAIVSAFLVWKFLAILACALLFGLVFHRYSVEMVASSAKRPLLEIFRGLVILVAMPIISILIFVTVIGIPLGILGLMGYISLLIFSCIVAPIILGSVTYGYFSKRGREVSWKTILFGVILYSLLGLIPFVGWLVQFGFMLLALGSVATLKWRLLKEWR